MNAVKTQVKQMTVIDLLLEQHARLEELFQLVETSKGKAKQSAFKELAELLLVHEASEAEVVHPLAAQSIDSGVEVIDERLEEEDEAKELLQKLIKAGTGDAAFDADFQLLRTAVLEHATREERYEFYRLRASHPHEVLVELAEQVRAVQSREAGA